MSNVKFNKYMNELADKLVESGITRMSAEKYIKDLYRLNGEKGFRNLVFLKDIPKIMERVKERKSKNTQAGYMGSILGVLGLYKSMLKYGKMSAEYLRLYKQLRAELAEDLKTHKKSTKQKENWMTWEEVLNKRDELGKTLGEDEGTTYRDLLRFVVLSLYTYIPPRRNEFVNMFVVDKRDQAKNQEENYYVIDDKVFIFNQFKTKRYMGSQEVAVPKTLELILSSYLDEHPTYKKGKKTRLLVKADGSPLPATNGITRILNEIFKPVKISSTALRHIYLSSKYGETTQEKQEDADAMAHSVSQQNNYIKIDTEPISKAVPSGNKKTSVITKMGKSKPVKIDKST